MNNPADFCVINVGSHDMLIPQITSKQYIENVVYFLKHLKGCLHIVWLETCSVGNTLNNNAKLNNKRIKLWNKLLFEDDHVMNLLDDVIHTFDISLNFKHTDPMHFHAAYYEKIVWKLTNQVLNLKMRNRGANKI